MRLKVFSSAAASLIVALSLSPQAFAFDPSSLPQVCRDTLTTMKGEKGRFTELGKLMGRYRKASDTANFCVAARQIVVMIKQQSDRLDGCVGELSSASGVAESASVQMLQLRTLYKEMLEASKNEKNDQFHCGLADQS